MFGCKVLCGKRERFFGGIYITLSTIPSTIFLQFFFYLSCSINNPIKYLSSNFYLHHISLTITTITFTISHFTIFSGRQSLWKYQLVQNTCDRTHSFSFLMRRWRYSKGDITLVQHTFFFNFFFQFGSFQKTSGCHFIFLRSLELPYNWYVCTTGSTWNVYFLGLCHA